MREEKNNKELLGDEVLHNVALNCMKKESSALEEMINSKPHVFSEEFERKMQEVMRVETPAERAARLRKKRVQKIQIVATIIVTVVLAAGLMFQGNRNVLASDMKMRITQWLENAFLMEEGEAIRRKEGVLFEITQMEYIPENFKVVEEESSFIKKYIKFENESGKYFVLQIYHNKANAGIDNKDIAQESGINQAGFEYRYFYNQESKEHTINWLDKNNLYYLLNGNIDMEEVIKIMDGIED